MNTIKLHTKAFFTLLGFIGLAIISIIVSLSLILGFMFLEQHYPTETALSIVGTVVIIFLVSAYRVILDTIKSKRPVPLKVKK